MRRSGPALTAMGLMIVVLATACGEAAVTTTSPPPETTTTSPPPETTTTEAAPVTSEEVALAFFNAWQAGDREVMEQLSEPSALAEADSLAELASETWEPELCEGAAGTVHCIWISDAGTLAIGVRNIEEPHVVTSFGLVDP
jgi:hypothetical protein